MPEPAEDGNFHVQHLLGLYYLDELDKEGNEAVRRHLPGCATCQAAAEREVDTIAALALLLEEQPAAPLRTATAARVELPPHVVRRVDHRAGPPPRKRVRERTKRQSLIRAGGLLVLAIVLGGLGIGGLLHGTPTDKPPTVSRIADAADTSKRIRAVVFVTQTGGAEVQVTAKFTGLTVGTRYKVSATSANGEPYEVTTWTCDTGSQTVTGALSVDVGQLSSVTLSTGDGGTVLVAPLTQPSTSPTR